jgi:hypothetical protein
MILVLINALILLFAIGMPISALLWKNFAKSPSESIRATIATFAGMVGLALFFIQVFIMTAETGKNIITMLIVWFGG